MITQYPSFWLPMQMSQRVCPRHWVNCVTAVEIAIGESLVTSELKKLFKRCRNQMLQSHFSSFSESLSCTALFLYNWEMIILIYLFVLLWEEAHGWGIKDGIFHNSIWLGKKLHSCGFCWNFHFFGDVNQYCKYFCSVQVGCFPKANEMRCHWKAYNIFRKVFIAFKM